MRILVADKMSNIRPFQPQPCSWKHESSRDKSPGEEIIFIQFKTFSKNKLGKLNLKQINETKAVFSSFFEHGQKFKWHASSPYDITHQVDSI